MKDRDIDTHLKQCLPADLPRGPFKQQALRDSTAEFLRVRQRRSAWRNGGLAVAAMLIIGVAFLAGRLSVPRQMPERGSGTPLAESRSNGVTVPRELVAWLDAAWLFGQLGMEDRMARAVEHAGKLMPVNIVITDDQVGQMFAATRSTENQNMGTESMDLLGPHPSTECANQILALSLGD